MTLVTARVVQGVAAALLVPARLALIQASYGDHRARTRAVGIAVLGSFVAAGAGVVAGARPAMVVATAAWLVDPGLALWL